MESTIISKLPTNEHLTRRESLENAPRLIVPDEARTSITRDLQSPSNGLSRSTTMTSSAPLVLPSYMLSTPTRDHSSQRVAEGVTTDASESFAHLPEGSGWTAAYKGSQAILNSSCLHAKLLPLLLMRRSLVSPEFDLRLTRPENAYRSRSNGLVISIEWTGINEVECNSLLT